MSRSQTPDHSPANRRVKTELEEFRNMTNEQRGMHNIKLVDDSNLRHLHGFVTGPSETPFEGGRFELDILIPEDYPFTPPKVRLRKYRVLSLARVITSVLTRGKYFYSQGGY